MNEEERLSLNNYIEDLYQAMQIGDIIFDSNHSNELYNLINKLLKENQQLKEKLQQKEDIINKIRKCIDEKEEYYGDYMGDGKYQMYSMMGANNSRTPYIQSNLIKKILDNKGDENDG